MGVISIRVNDDLESQIAIRAKAKGISVSAYCKDILSSAKEEPQIDRLAVEFELDEIKKSMNILNKNMLNLSKEILKEIHMNSSLIVGFFSEAFKQDIDALAILKDAEAETDKYISNIFKG